MNHLCDCHAHTWYSFDAKCNIDELCTGAIRAGLSVLAITEHYDYDTRGGTAHYGDRHARRMEEMRAAARRYAPRLELLCGVEIGQPHLWPEESRTFAETGGFDVVLGSLHDLRPGTEIYTGFDYSDPAVCDAVYHRFFDEAEEMLRCGGFDVFAHYDYPLRLMQQLCPDGSMRQWKARMLPFLRSLAQSGVALELNTSGFRRWQKKPAGEAWILNAYREAGGRRISVGSDAHRADQVGSGIPQVYEILLQNGFDEVTVYRRRQPVQLSIR